MVAAQGTSRLPQDGIGNVVRESRKWILAPHQTRRCLIRLRPAFGGYASQASTSSGTEIGSFRVSRITTPNPLVVDLNEGLERDIQQPTIMQQSVVVIGYPPGARIQVLIFIEPDILSESAQFCIGAAAI
jgi:hypothetical protein